MATYPVDVPPRGVAEQLGLGRWIAAADFAPTWAAEGSTTVVVDGALHNRDALTRALGADAAGVENDADLVLRAYRAWGPAGLERLRGAYAVGLWDAADGALLCARDPMGIRPLFYAVDGSEVVLSTSIDALVADPAVPATVSALAVADHLYHRWPDPGETYFEAVRRIPGGHLLRADAAGRSVDRLWDPLRSDNMEWIGEDELERFDEVFAEAVGRCLDDGPVGIFLSGGLDSVSVAALATDASGARGFAAPQALSLIFPDPECNEEVVQTGVARTLDLPQVLIGMDEAVGGEGLMLSGLELSSRRPAPLVSHWAPAFMRLAREGVERGCRAILTGHGGDEWLTVTPLYAADLLRSLNLAGLARLASSHQRSFNVTPFQAWRNAIWTFGGQVLMRAAAGRFLEAMAPGRLRAHHRASVRQGRLDWVAPDPALRAQLDDRAEQSRPAPVRGSHYLNEMRMALGHPLVAMEMEEAVENGRDAGLRMYAPFLDADLIDFLIRTPPGLLSRAGRSKGLVRDTLARRFPDLGFERQRKVAATSYAKTVMVDQTPRAWRRMGGLPALADLGVVDPHSFDREVVGKPDKDYLEHFRIWDALNLEAWVRARA